MNKQCTSCKQHKPNSNFQKRAASKDGLTASCKECLKERDKNRYSKERDRRIKMHKTYMQTAAGKNAHKLAIKKWQGKHPRRRAANITLNNAIHTGKVQKHPCWVCGEKAEAHHPDYSEPLLVVWLCRPHHMAAHNAVQL
jgi:hypothetical protein